MTRIVQFGVPFSPNLGDGVISDCLAHALGTRAPHVEMTAIDLSRRRGFGDVTVRNRALVIRALGLMPTALRQRLVSARLTRMLDRVEADWQAAVRGTDLAIIGGGQLFSDADLNFCLKIARASAVLAREGVPVVVHAAGVASNWSPKGRALFAEILGTNLRMVGLRDVRSIEAWNAQMTGQGGVSTAPAPELTRDPGLLAVACYGDVLRTDRIGIGVTAAEILAYHAEDPRRSDAGPDLFAGLALALADHGHRVALFCNGAVEDRAVLERMKGCEDLLRRGVEVLPAPETPAQLARLIGSFQTVVAHRLHACILGYAYGLPVVGLGWDRKVESFFGSVERSEFFVPPGETAIPRIVELVERGLMTGLDPAIHAQVVAETWDGIDRALASGLGPQTCVHEGASAVRTLKAGAPRR